MEKLKQLINCNHILSINHPEIISERLQLQLLYDELDHPMIQTLFFDQHQDLEEHEYGFERTLNQSAAPISFTRNSQGYRKLEDEIVVGLDDDAGLIRDKLVEDQKKVDVVSIVGTCGIGKTTLVTKVFNDGYVKHHFHVRVWVTVSQIYDKRDVLIQILTSMGVKRDLGKASDSQLREMVHKHLMGHRYLIVIDDTWDIKNMG
ncbi:hypothetical protein L1987_38204 [Smallanthus sonchifolius]|uniref:Uncharacterized protein n=1 Tax=Smallanthus sonchifolius TaxID=185202 RepID=A0ACB9HI00_9ASTR|nr:hypothetical protein L1987_38204 [Smallanthus sonchifolius]